MLQTIPYYISTNAFFGLPTGGFRTLFPCIFQLHESAMTIDIVVKSYIHITIFSLNSVFDMISLDISDKVRLFDSMVLPILCYGPEVWEFHKAVDIERVHTKSLLSVRQHTSNVCMYVW